MCKEAMVTMINCAELNIEEIKSLIMKYKACLSGVVDYLVIMLIHFAIITMIYLKGMLTRLRLKFWDLISVLFPTYQYMAYKYNIFKLS